MTPFHVILGESLIHKVIVSNMRQGTYIKKKQPALKRLANRDLTLLYPKSDTPEGWTPCPC